MGVPPDSVTIALMKKKRRDKDGLVYASFRFSYLQDHEHST